MATMTKRMSKKEKAITMLDDNGLSRVWELYHMSSNERIAAGAADMVHGSLEYTPMYCILREMVDKLLRWGSLSEKQIKFLHSIVERIGNRKEIEAKRAIDKMNTKDCPAGKVVVEGTVIKVKTHFNRYGESLKMTVKHDDGWLVWGSVPSNLQLFNVEKSVDGEIWTEQRGLVRNDRVRFTGTVVVSDTDSKFGFFKRPTQASLVE